MNPDVRGPWSEYRRLVVDSLEDIKRRLDAIEERLQGIDQGLTVQKVKMGMIAGVSGAVFGGAVAAAVKWLVP